MGYVVSGDALGTHQHGHFSQGEQSSQKLRHAIEVALEQFAKEANRPELPLVPRTGTGFSAGGMVVNVLEKEPEKMLTNAISCSWVRDPDVMGDAAAVPELFIIGAVPDAFKMLPAIEKHFEPAIAANRPWALGLQHGCKHDWANSGTLSVAWIQAIAKLRYPDQVDVAKPIPLSSVAFADGWLGDRTTIDGTFPAVQTAAGFDGKQASATWLPDRATAYIWRAWQVKNSPVDLAIRTVDGSHELPPFQPKKSFGMTVKPGVDLLLDVRVQDERKLTKVEYYHGDQLLGTAAEHPWAVSWSSDRIGCYAIWAQYHSAGKTAATNPALICLEPTE